MRYNKINNYLSFSEVSIHNYFQRPLGQKNTYVGKPHATII